MRRWLPLVLGLAWSWSGCSTDASGLGEDVPADSATLDDTGSLEEDTSVVPDSTLEDTTVADTAKPDSSSVDTAKVDSSAADSSAADSSVTETSSADTAASDSASDDTSADTTVTDAVLVDSVAEATADVVSEATADVVTDTGPVLVSTPGSIACTSACGKKYCCGAPKFSGGYDWQCVDNCGLFGIGVLDYSCDEKADCSGGKLCCVNISGITGNWQGSECRSGCGSDPQLCLTNAECPTGKTCSPSSVFGAPFSYATCK